MSSYRNIAPTTVEALERLARIMDNPPRAAARPSATKRARQLRADELVGAKTAYEAGASMNELARQFRVHTTTISKHFVALGVPIREVSVSAKQVDEARRLYEGGMALPKFAQR